MSIACNDLIQFDLDKKIKNQKLVLRENYDNLKKIAVENKFYQSVLDDYDKYYNYIINDKKKQYASLKAIYEYLEGLVSNTSALKDQAENLKQDQHNVLSKLSQIRNDLEEITSVQ